MIRTKILAVALTMAALVAACDPPPGMTVDPVVNGEPTHEAEPGDPGLVTDPVVQGGSTHTEMATAADCCWPYYKLERVVADPHHTLRKSWWAGISVESGYPTAVASTRVNHRGAYWQARAVHGFDSLGSYHKRDYVISHMVAHSVQGWATNNDSYGWTVVMWDGNTFEGCDLHDNFFGGGTAFVCDYYSHKMSAPWPQNEANWWYQLKKTWGFWHSQTGNQLGCAAALSNVLALAWSWVDGWLADCWIQPR